MRPMAVMALAVMTAGCGGTPGGGGGLLASGPGWNATDACKTLDQAAVAAATGQKVTKAETTKSEPKGNSPSALSECEYTLADGTKLSFLTRVSPDDDISGDVAGFVDQTKAAGMPAPSMVPGVGKGGFWQSNMGKMPQLTFFAGAHELGVLTFSRTVDGYKIQPVDETWAKDAAVKLAKKISA